MRLIHQLVKQPLSLVEATGKLRMKQLVSLHSLYTISWSAARCESTVGTGCLLPWDIITDDLQPCVGIALTERAAY